MKLCILLHLLCLCCQGLTEEPSLTPEASDVSFPVDKEKETEEKVHSCEGRQVFSTEEHRMIGGAIERLGLQLLENLPIGPQQPNVVLSPFSLAFALAHLTLGARSETEKLLLKSLHAESLPCYHHILGGLVPHFSNMDVATRMYLEPGLEVKSSFVKDSLVRYQSQPIPLPSLEEINHWVDNVTNGHIPNFLERIPHDVVLMLINAVYFKGELFYQRPLNMSVSQSSSILAYSSLGSLGSAANPSALQWEAGIHPRWSPANRRVHTPFTPTLIPTGNLESPINLSMFLDCGRKPEYPLKTNADKGRTCKLHTERSQTQYN